MIGFLPVISSRSITPKEKTSDRSLTLPVAAYSGARYLQTKRKDSTNAPVHASAGYDVLYVGKLLGVPTSQNDYPKVPITRVETAVTSAAWYLAKPKSATYTKKSAPFS
jgi:hypothetical protein